MTKKRGLLLIFIGGFFSAVFGSPILTAIGVPSFDVVLTALFGEENPWAVIFSITLIVLIIFCISNVIERFNVKQVK